MSDSHMLWVSDYGPVEPPKEHVEQFNDGELMYIGDAVEEHITCDVNALVALEDYQ